MARALTSLLFVLATGAVCAYYIHGIQAMHARNIARAMAEGER